MIEEKTYMNHNINNKILHAFEHGKAFIPFITCGDPSMDVTEQHLEKSV